MPHTAAARRAGGLLRREGITEAHASPDTGRITSRPHTSLTPVPPSLTQRRQPLQTGATAGCKTTGAGPGKRTTAANRAHSRESATNARDTPRDPSMAMPVAQLASLTSSASTLSATTPSAASRTAPARPMVRAPVPQPRRRSPRRATGTRGRGETTDGAARPGPGA